MVRVTRPGFARSDLPSATCRPANWVVFGVGDIDARIMFVGEAPGADEEIQGEPFVGPAGQLLTKMIQGMGLERAEVYIGNIMNWRPEMKAINGIVPLGNRPPTAQEMAYCLPYLKAQIEIVNPEIVVALGATAATGLLGAGSVPDAWPDTRSMAGICQQAPDGDVSSELYFGGLRPIRRNG